MSHGIVEVLRKENLKIEINNLIFINYIVLTRIYAHNQRREMEKSGLRKIKDRNNLILNN